MYSYLSLYILCKLYCADKTGYMPLKLQAKSILVDIRLSSKKNRHEHEWNEWRIQDFPDGVRQLSRGGCANLLFHKVLAKNYMKIKEFRPRRGLGTRPLDPPMIAKHQTKCWIMNLECSVLSLPHSTQKFIQKQFFRLMSLL